MQESSNKKILVIVEGPSDKGFIEGLLQKLKIKGKVIIMKGNRPSKAIKYMKHYSEYDKIILLKDFEKHSEKAVKKLTNKIFEKARKELHGVGKLHIVFVKRSIESWMLADETLIKRLYGHEVKRVNCEELLNPSNYLDKILGKCGKAYIKNYELAKGLALN